MHGGTSPQAKRKARERMLEAEVWRTLGSWMHSPAGQEYRDRIALADDRAALARDRAALEALAARLGVPG